MKKFVLRYGIIGGCISVTLSILNWFTVAQYLGYNASQVVGFSSIALALLCVPLGIKYYRDKLNNGVVSFAKAFKIGVGITTITGIIMFFESVLFFILEGERFKKWRVEGLSPEEVENVQKQMESMPDFVWTPWFHGIVMFVMVFIIGLVINLISSFILKKKRVA